MAAFSVFKTFFQYYICNYFRVLYKKNGGLVCLLSSLRIKPILLKMCEFAFSLLNFASCKSGQICFSGNRSINLICFVQAPTVKGKTKASKFYLREKLSAVPIHLRNKHLGHNRYAAFKTRHSPSGIPASSALN